MITEVSFENYRCFKKLKLSNLKRMNIVVGQNGHGKTTFLEGLYMVGGASPELFFRTRAWRGLTPIVRIESSAKANEGLFRSLFSRHDRRNHIQLQMVDAISGRRSLKIFYSEEEIMTLPLDSMDNREQNAVTSFPITFQWEFPTGAIHTATVQLLDDKVTMPSATDVYPVILQSPMTVSAPRETAKRFSEVSKRGQLSHVLREVSSIYPQIADLSLEYEGDESIIHATTEFCEQKMPVQFISGGITKYLTILFSILTNQNGVVLVDEIENGFYFGKLEDVWKSFARQCKEQATQMFVTTHSCEFLKALGPSMKDNPDEYCLLRAEKEDG